VPGGVTLTVTEHITQWQYSKIIASRENRFPNTIKELWEL